LAGFNAIYYELLIIRYKTLSCLAKPGMTTCTKSEADSPARQQMPLFRKHVTLFIDRRVYADGHMNEQ